MAIPTISQLERAFSKIKDWAGIRAASKLIHDGMSGGGGSGTVTDFSAGDLSPVFTSSVATSTTTPDLTFALDNAAAHSYLGNNTGSSGAPGYHQIAYSELTGTPAAAGPRGLVFGFAKSSGVTTGKLKGYVTVDYSGTITGYTLSKFDGTSITIAFWKKSSGTALPTVADSINTSGLTLTGDHVRSSTVSDFTTTTVTAGDVFAVQVTAVTGTITDFAGTLEITPT